jgi:hypothetical protein
MAWKEIPGLKGKVYIPDEEKRTLKKHGCEQCFSCQLCSDDRCRLCDDRQYPEKRNEILPDKICGVSEKTTCGLKICNGLN